MRKTQQLLGKLSGTKMLKRGSFQIPNEQQKQHQEKNCRTSRKELQLDS